MRFYLAGKYGRRTELLVYAGDLRALGHDVVARWLDGDAVHDPSGALAESCERAWDATGSYPAEAAPFAWSDWHDIGQADAVVFFTEDLTKAARGGGVRWVEASSARGGRHVEFGLALAWGKRVMVVGPRENVFYALPVVDRFDSWADVVALLSAEAVA